MHRRLNAETAKPPRSSMRGPSRRFDAFLDEYNNERPHEAIGQLAPSSLCQPSERPFRRVTLARIADTLNSAAPSLVKFITWRGSQWYLSVVSGRVRRPRRWVTTAGAYTLRRCSSALDASKTRASATIAASAYSCE